MIGAVLLGGEWGADSPDDLHRLSSAFAVFRFRVEPVMDVMDAVAAEVDAIRWRDALPHENSARS